MMLEKVLVGAIKLEDASLYPPFIHADVHFVDGDGKHSKHEITALLKDEKCEYTLDIDKLVIKTLTDAVTEYIDTIPSGHKVSHVSTSYYFEHVVNVTWRDKSHIAFAYIPNDESVIVLPTGMKIDGTPNVSDIEYDEIY